ncbi:MAG: hypothetical protein IJX91_00310 [Clostridia bacterium]|nr:hypothetical protein [Clostridia bacterium]
MTEEMLKSITEAEARASAIKNAAYEKAAALVAEAEKQAARTEQSSAEVCKAYAETQVKNARAEAERRFEISVKTEEKQAREYCAQALENAEDCIGKIVGRIVGGNC